VLPLALRYVRPPLLDTHAATSFQVLKEIVDVLIEDPFGASPYLVPVEIQICPLDAYLGTLHESDFTSRFAQKERQFLNQLLPVLFPVEIYWKHKEAARA
jgi:hypothetical protein